MHQIKISKALKVHLAFKLKIEPLLLVGIFGRSAHLVFDYQTRIFLQVQQLVGMIKWHRHLAVDLELMD